MHLRRLQCGVRRNCESAVLAGAAFSIGDAVSQTDAVSGSREFSILNAEAPALRAALWMSGWLALMLIMPVAGREAAREIDLIQVMEMRSIIGFLMLYPLIHRSGGLARGEDHAALAARVAQLRALPCAVWLAACDHC